jgi:hypothetical protein
VCIHNTRMYIYSYKFAHIILTLYIHAECEFDLKLFLYFYTRLNFHLFHRCIIEVKKLFKKTYARDQYSLCGKITLYTDTRAHNITYIYNIYICVYNIRSDRGEIKSFSFFVYYGPWKSLSETR